MPLSLDAFAAASAPRRSVCTVAKIVEQLDTKDRAVLEAAFADPDVTHAAIERVLASEGHMVTATTLGRHRRGECGCGR